MKLVVSMDYVDGVKEGRRTLERLVADGCEVNATEMASELRAFIELLKQCAYSAPHMDFAIGELHFWEGQEKDETSHHVESTEQG